MTKSHSDRLCYVCRKPEKGRSQPNTDRFICSNCCQKLNPESPEYRAFKKGQKK